MGVFQDFLFVLVFVWTAKNKFLITKEEVQDYELFTDANAWTPERFWNYSLVKKEDSMTLKYYERSTFWVKLDIEKELEKHGKIPLKFLKH